MVTSAQGLRNRALFDSAADWLVQRGRAGQWGTEPLSHLPSFVAKLNG